MPSPEANFLHLTDFCKGMAILLGMFHSLLWRVIWLARRTRVYRVKRFWSGLFLHTKEHRAVWERLSGEPAGVDVGSLEAARAGDSRIV
jgi:hypothetical protein